MVSFFESKKGHFSTGDIKKFWEPSTVIGSLKIKAGGCKEKRFSARKINIFMGAFMLFFSLSSFTTSYGSIPVIEREHRGPLIRGGYTDYRAPLKKEVEAATPSSRVTPEMLSLAMTGDFHEFSFDTGVVPEENGIAPFVWKGGAPMDSEDIRRAIQEVCAELDISLSDNLKKFILECLAIESHFGRVAQQKGGPAQGALQIVPQTRKYIVQELLDKKEYKTFKTAAEKFRLKGMSTEENVLYNFHYSLVLFFVYLDYRGDLLDKATTLSTVKARYTFYKRHWNSYKGRATQTAYVERAKEAKQLF